MHGERSAKRAYGSGSIIERRGDYYGKWRVGGRQVLRKLGPKRSAEVPDGLTPKQAEQRLRERMAQTEAEQAEPRRQTPSTVTIAELGARYIAYAREHRGVKESTLSEYDSSLRCHLIPFFGARPIAAIDAEGIEAFATHLRTKKGQGWRGGKTLAPKTIDNHLGALAVLLNFAVRKKLIDASPMNAVDLPKHGGDAPIEELQFLEPHEVARLIASAQSGVFHRLDRALYTLAAYSGLRQGELRGLRWDHIDIERSIVHVLESVTKGRRTSPKGRRRRVVPLAPSVIQALRDLHAESHWTAPSDPVFATPSTGQPMSRTQLMERYRAALTAAGLPLDFSFHDLRHTFGTTMARAGVPVGTLQAWMGHADLATTQLYMHYAPAEQDAARIEAAFGPRTALTSPVERDRDTDAA
jgi:integrase